MKVKIKREIPAREEFDIDIEKDLTLLEILYRIKETDPTLSFRNMCRAGICGTCAVKLNGKPYLGICWRSYIHKGQAFGRPQ